MLHLLNERLAACENQAVVDEGEDIAGDGFFGAVERGEDGAVGGEDFDVVVGRRDGGGGVRDDEVAVFAFEFCQRAEAVVFGFEGEADDPAGAFARRQRGDDILRFDEA